MHFVSLTRSLKATDNARSQSQRIHYSCIRTSSQQAIFFSERCAWHWRSVKPKHVSSHLYYLSARSTAHVYTLFIVVFLVLLTSRNAPISTSWPWCFIVSVYFRYYLLNHVDCKLERKKRKIQLLLHRRQVGIWLEGFKYSPRTYKLVYLIEVSTHLCWIFHTFFRLLQWLGFLWFLLCVFLALFLFIIRVFNDVNSWHIGHNTQTSSCCFCQNSFDS